MGRTAIKPCHSSAESIAAWKANVEHHAAQQMGKSAWYEHYEIPQQQLSRPHKCCYDLVAAKGRAKGLPLSLTVAHVPAQVPVSLQFLELKVRLRHVSAAPVLPIE